jgi:hypothetical protein
LSEPGFAEAPALGDALGDVLGVGSSAKRDADSDDAAQRNRTEADGCDLALAVHRLMLLSWLGTLCPAHQPVSVRVTRGHTLRGVIFSFPTADRSDLATSGYT